MGDPRGFLKFKRQAVRCRPVCERVKDYGEVSVLCGSAHHKEQASRCMDCGVPFCHWGCPAGNYIPEWNDLVFNGRLKAAAGLLEATNDLPEVTGRICPAPCEYACVLGINDDPVTIRDDELFIIEQAFEKGFIRPRPPRRRTGRRVAVVGSGPAGLVCAARLNRAGHSVTVYERDDSPGGIMRYGIPDFKLGKCVIDRRLKIWEKEGVKFETNVDVGRSRALSLRKESDAVVLACGSRAPRDLKIPGRELSGIHFAMDYLVEANKRCAPAPRRPSHPASQNMDAMGRRVIVIGGGDSGADCVGVAHRQGASSVLQIELLPQPPSCRSAEHPWPKYPFILKTSTSHEEGGQRQWSVLTKGFIGENGRVRKMSCVKTELEKDASGCPVVKEIPGSEFEIEADLVILALGFLYPEKKGPIEGLGLELDSRGNVKTGADFMSSAKGVFACGDMRRGQSLVVWAVYEGSRCAHYVDKHLRIKPR